MKTAKSDDSARKLKEVLDLIKPSGKHQDSSSKIRILQNLASRNNGILNRLQLVFDDVEAESMLRRAHINILIYYLMGTRRDNHCIFNDVAMRILGDDRIRGRRRQLFEKFIGSMAADRLCGKLEDRRDAPWED